MRRPPPVSTRSYTLFPSTTLFRSEDEGRAKIDRHDTVPQLETRRGQAGLRKEAGAVDDGADSEVRRDPFHQRLGFGGVGQVRSEEHTSELQSLMRTSYAVFCLKKKKIT